MDVVDGEGMVRGIACRTGLDCAARSEGRGDE